MGKRQIRAKPGRSVHKHGAGADLKALADRLYARARDVFGSEESAREWLTTPQQGLGSRVPLELLATEAGAAEVRDLLGRIEYGVPA